MPGGGPIMRRVDELRDAALRGLAASHLVILDVGAGRHSALRVEGARLVGLDPSAAELAANPALDERIVGSIEDAELPPRAFHVAVLWDVLEHLDRPWAALSKVSKALTDQAAIVIAAPDPLSLKGQITKWTPLWFHRLMVRRLLPFVERDPFPTYLRLRMCPSGIRRWARREGFEVVYFARQETLIQRRARERLRLLGWRWRVVRGLFRAATLGFGTAATTDYTMVLRRVGHAAAAADINDR
jgi:hypothetical protein